jgi:hypothetical protein
MAKLESIFAPYEPRLHSQPRYQGAGWVPDANVHGQWLVAAVQENSSHHPCYVSDWF